MPPFEEIFEDKALLWAAVGRDTRVNVLVSTAVEIECSWIAKRRTVRDPQGNVKTIDATVHADRSVPLDSIMWYGGHDDVPGTGTVPDEGFFQVVGSDDTRAIAGDAQLHELQLIRYRGTLPVRV